MAIVVRKYQNDDLEQVNVVLEEAFSVSKKNFSLDNIIEVVAESDHVVCGYLMLTKIMNPIKEKHYYLVDYVCVSSSYRGLGISDQLMKYAEEIAREDHAMYLQLTCSYHRLAAHKLYERCGYIKRESDIFRKVLE